jgi:F-type H+-transporting ATPase subunit gamma
MEDLERVQDRLDRIGAIQPVLSALRTISLASWRLALRQRAEVQRYADHLLRAARSLPANLLQQQPVRPRASRPLADHAPARIAVLVLGSERGLCGRFNVSAIEQAEEFLALDPPAGAEIEIMALGTRLARMLSRRGHALAWTERLSLTALPPFDLAQDLTRQWLARFERGDLDELRLIYNDYRGVGQYEPRTIRFIPLWMLVDCSNGMEEPDPEPILETDARSLQQRITTSLAAARLHEVLISSAAAEHSTRYQLMDGAAQNAERIIDELTLAVQSARQQAITREMQELAVGAGLIGPQSS